jgi:YHS domain-containing protein
MFGYDRNKDPVVEQRVTAKEARRIAHERGLTGYFLAPHWSEAPNSGGMRAYRWNPERGEYEDWNMRAWVFTHILDPKVPGTGLEEEPARAR